MEQLMQVQWGSFSTLHIITLIISLAAVPLTLYFTLKNRSEKTKRIVLFICSLWGPTSVLYSFFVWGSQTSYLEYLPFHMCAINAMLIPVLIITKSKLLGNMLPLFSLGALFALVFNTFQADYRIFSMVFACYYFAHTFELCIPFLLIKFGIVKTHPKYILPSVGLTFAFYTVAHFVNLWVNNYIEVHQLTNIYGEPIIPDVDYMFTPGPSGNPALEFFWNILPYPYFYLLTTAPIVAAYYSLLNLNHFVKWIKGIIANKKAKTQSNA